MTRTPVLVLGFVACVALVAPAYAQEGTACAPEPTDELIEYGEMRTCVINPIGELDVFRFVGAAGEIVRIVVSESGIHGGEVRAQLRDMAGAIIVNQTSEVSTTIELALPASGEYSLLVSESGNDAGITYDIALERVTPVSPASTTLESGTALSGQVINPFGDLDIYVFQGTSGDLIRIDASENGIQGGEICVDLRRPDGSSVNGVVCNEVTVLIETTLDQTGSFVVIASESGNDAGLSFNILYTCLLGSCTALTRPRCESTLSQSTYTAGETVRLATLRVVNPTTEAVQLTFWVDIPTAGPARLTAGPIPAGFDQSWESLPVYVVHALHPLGEYTMGCRLQSVATGETLALDLDPYDVD